MQVSHTSPILPRPVAAVDGVEIPMDENVVAEYPIAVLCQRTKPMATSPRRL